MLKDEGPIFFSKHLFYGLVKVVLQNFDVFYCVDLTVASNQSPIPLGTMHPQNITETEFLKWAEKSQYASFFRSSPNGKCFAIIF